MFFIFVIISINANAEVTSAELFQTINERLSYMEDVALYKAKNHIPIEDVVRERLVVDKAKASARDIGLEPTHIEDFFKAQISVAKAIQFRFRADLLSQPSAKEPKDLKKEIRPHLLRLGDQSIQKILSYVKKHGSFKQISFSEFEAAIKVRYVTVSDKKLLFRALLKIK